MIKGLDPAATIIAMCGGIARVAKVCARDKKTVYRWCQPKGPRGGTGGTIPIWHARTLMQAFPDVTPELFFRNIRPRETVALSPIQQRIVDRALRRSMKIREISDGD